MVRYSQGHILVSEDLPGLESAHDNAARYKGRRVAAICCRCEHLLIFREKVRGDLTLVRRHVWNVVAHGALFPPEGNPMHNPYFNWQEREQELEGGASDTCQGQTTAKQKGKGN